MFRFSTRRPLNVLDVLHLQRPSLGLGRFVSFTFIVNMDARLPEASLFREIEKLLATQDAKELQWYINQFALSFVTSYRRKVRAPESYPATQEVFAYNMSGLKSATTLGEQYTRFSLVTTETQALLAGISWVVGVVSQADQVPLMCDVVVNALMPSFKGATLLEDELDPYGWAEDADPTELDLGYLIWETSSNHTIMVRFHVLPAEHLWLLSATCAWTPRRTDS